jgi:hypothetical protein
LSIADPRHSSEIQRRPIAMPIRACRNSLTQE